MKKRLGPDVFILLGLLALFAALAYHIAQQNDHDAHDPLHPRRTTFSSRKGGWKAFYLLLEREGFHLKRVTKSPEAWPGNMDVVITGPERFSASAQGVFKSTFWDDTAVNDSLLWVDNGGTLILLMDEDSDLLTKLKLEHQDYLAKDATLPPVEPAVFLDNIRGVKVPDSVRWRKIPASAVPLLADKHPAAVLIPHGSGRIIAICQPAIADNAHLGEADNARFLTQLVAAYAETGKDAPLVAFDEFHQGYADSEEDSSLWTAIGRPGQFAFLQLVAVALLAAYSAAKRFGRPRPVPEPPRVTSEYVASLADLYRRARAGEAALEAVYLSFWRDLCRTVGLPLDADASVVAPRAAVALSSGKSDSDTKALAARLQKLLEACENRIAAPGSKGVGDAELLRLAREIEDLRKELSLGGNAD